MAKDERDKQADAIVSALMQNEAPSSSINFGAGHLTNISVIEGIFECGRACAIRILAALRVPPSYIGKSVYFSWDSFRRILFVVTAPGNKPFVFPGSSMISKDRFTKNRFDYLTEVTDEMVDLAKSDDLLKALKDASGRSVPISTRDIKQPLQRRNRPPNPEPPSPPCPQPIEQQPWEARGTYRQLGAQIE